MDIDIEPFPEGMTKPLGNTIKKKSQGEAVVRYFRAGYYPACTNHGAMNRVSKAHLWRCLQCNIGIEIAANPDPRKNKHPWLY